MDSQEIKEAVREATREVLNETLGELYVDRETHYLHHKFITDVMCTVEKTKGTVLTTMTRLLVIGLVALVVMGIIFWGKDKF